MMVSDATKHSSAGAPQPLRMSVKDQLEFSDETVIKCYKCYSEQVSAICHHCGRLLCKECQFNPFGSLHTDNVFARMHTLPNIFKQSAHCANCFHYGDTIARLVMPAILVMAAILILLPPVTQLARQQTVSWTALVPLAPWWGAGALALLLAKLTWGLYPHLPFPVKYPLGIPVFPRYTIELDEHVRADFNITPDCYLSPSIPCGGQLTIKLGLVPEDAERYISALKPRLRDGKMTLHAGFVALDKQKKVRFLKNMKQHLGNSLTFSIMGEIAPDEFIKLCRERQPIEWAGHYRIEPESLRLGPKYDKEFPFFIKPRLLPGGLRLELILELHKDMTGKVMLDYLTLKAPPVFCGMEGTEPTTPAVEDTDGQFDPPRGQIVWHRKKVATDAPLVLYIEFRKPLSTQSWRFEGEYELIIEGSTLSGLKVGEDPYVKGQPTETGRYMIRPASGNLVRTEEIKWMDPTVKHKTTIKGKVAFETSTFLAYSIHTEPKAPEQPEECHCVSPNHKIIDAIIAALTDPRRPDQPQVYIQQVVEALGHVTEAGIGGKQARCWEIKGRYYIGLHETHEEGAKRDRPSSPRIPKEPAIPNQAMTSSHFADSVSPPPLPRDPLTGQLQPVDVHLVIRGEESRDHSESAQDMLCFELVLRSVVSNGNQRTSDLQEYYEVPKEIEEDYKVLREVIGRTISEKGNQLQSSLTNAGKGASVYHGS